MFKHKYLAVLNNDLKFWVIQKFLNFLQLPVLEFFYSWSIIFSIYIDWPGNQRPKRQRAGPERGWRRCARRWWWRNGQLPRPVGAPPTWMRWDDGFRRAAAGRTAPWRGCWGWHTRRKAGAPASWRAVEKGVGHQGREGPATPWRARPQWGWTPSGAWTWWWRTCCRRAPARWRCGRGRRPPGGGVLHLVIVDAAEEELVTHETEPNLRAVPVKLRQLEGGGHHGVECVLGGLLTGLGGKVVHRASIALPCKSGIRARDFTKINVYWRSRNLSISLNP